LDIKEGKAMANWLLGICSRGQKSGIWAEFAVRRAKFLWRLIALGGVLLAKIF